MPGNDQSKGRPDHPGDQDQPNVSRRKLLGAAGVGAAGLAAGALGSMTAARAATTAKPAAAKPTTGEADHTDEEASRDEHVVVHVHAGADADIDVYRGTSQTRLNDPDLAARLRRAAP